MPGTSRADSIPTDGRMLGVSAALSLGDFHLDVAFEVGGGETVALVGPSGAGKTTCLEVITGLKRPQRGRVSLGHEVWCDTEKKIDRAPHERQVGFVDQDYALFPHLTVRGNVLFGSRMRRGNHAAPAASADQWLERLGLRALAGRSISELSGGQRQRVALARALASGAQVLLLDEPFGSHDVTTRAAVRGELRQFLADVRLPTVFVTHDATDALALADRIAVLESGRITQTGTREELLSRPRTSFVAELVGLNLYRAQLLPGVGLREARVGPVVFHVLGGDLEGEVSMAFPPSAATLSEQRPAGSAQNVFPGRVREILPIADRLRVILDCGVILAADVAHEAARALNLEPGLPLWVSVKATAIQVYP